MKVVSRIIAYNWRYFIFTVTVFVAFWHLLSLQSEIRTAEDKFNTALGQNVVNLEDSFLDNNAVEFQKILWQIKNDGIKYMRFTPAENRAGSWMFKEVAVGELLSGKFGVLSGTTEVVSNGAKLGRLGYVIDIRDINSVVFARNYALFITVVFFFMGLLIVSNLGAIQTLLAVERSVNEINSVVESGRGETVREAIQKHIGSLPAGIIGTPFAEMTGKMSDALGKAARLESELAISKATADLAAQVAHDIRSPLAALDTALRDLSALPAEQQALARGAMGRIGEIARDLLDNYKKPGAAAAENPPAPHDLKPLVEPVLAEKRAQYASKPGISIEFTAEEVRAAVQPAELRRIVSNLVNNAVEAFAEGGRVRVSLSRLDGRVLLQVSDNGKGIPQSLLARLGEKGGTHGKAGGTGLGLYHARKSAESWGGTLKIDSEPGKGTAVTLDFPALPAAKSAPKAAVLLDDDALVRMNWKTAARSAGAELKPFITPDELFSAAADIPKDTPFYIDSELGADAKGEDVAVRLRGLGFTDLTMATGHSPEKFSHLPWLKVAGKEPPWAA